MSMDTVIRGVTDPTEQVKTPRKFFLHKEGRWGLLLVSPYLIHFVFYAFVLSASLYYSFTNFNILSAPKFIGAENYVKLTQDPLFWKSLWNTTYFTILYVPIQTILALIMAVALNQQLKGLKLFRIAHFIPVISSWTVVYYVADAIFNNRFGFANTLLAKFGIVQQQWLNDEKLVIPILVLLAVWKGTGYFMVIFLSGLQSIPNDLYEAAELDGAGVFSKFRNVTLPLISGTTFLVLIMCMIQTFQAFEQIYVMTQGSQDPANIGRPNNNSLVLMLYMFREGFAYNHMGYASAIAWVLFAILLALTVIQVKVQKKWVYYDK